ncbi:MAG: DUF1385 domain-containing protein [bacterium]
MPKKKGGKKVNIIGGISFPGRIAILSDHYQAIAVWTRVKGKEGPVAIVRRLPMKSVAHPTLKHKWLPIPRVVRLFAFLFLAGNWFIKLFLILVVVGEVVQIVFPPSVDVVETVYLSPFFIATIYMFYIVLIIWFARFMAATRAWHGAEHMAIETYRQTGQSSIKSIAKFSPVSPYCGGRLFAPFLLIAFLAPALALTYGINDFLVTLVGLEIVLWIDALIGFYRIPIFREAAWLLQKYITTKKPSERELKTAHLALRELIKAHE